MNEHLVGAAVVARQLGMNRSSVYRMAKAGKIPSYAAGPKLSGIRFSLSELREALRRPARNPQSTGSSV